MAHSSVKSRANAFEALGSSNPKKKVVKKEVVPEKVFVPIVSSTSNWADSSDEEDVSAAPLYQRPAAAESPKEEESVDENEDTEEEEETEEEEQEEIVVSKKPAKSAPAMQLSKKDMKKKEMADLDSILAELGTPSPAAAVQEVKPPMPVKEAASNAVEVEVSMEELSILGIDTAASSSKKKRKKKEKEEKKQLRLRDSRRHIRRS